MLFTVVQCVVVCDWSKKAVFCFNLNLIIFIVDL